MVYCFLFKVGFLYQHFARCINHRLSCIQTDILDSIDYPLVYLVGEFIEVDILILLLVAKHAEYIDSKLSKHRSQFDIHTATTDGKTYLFRLQIYFCLMIFLIQFDAGNLCRAQGALDKEFDIRRVVDYIDVLIAEFTYDAMHTATLHTYAGSHWIDTLIIAFHSYLGALTRHTGHTADGNQTVIDFRNLSFKQALQECRTGTAQDDARIVVLVVHTLYHGTHGLTFVIIVSRYLLRLRQMQLVTLIIDEQHFALPHLIDLSTYHLSHSILIFLIERVMLQFQDFRSQCLTQVQDSAATELREVHFLTHFLTHFIVRFYLLSIFQADFLVIILHFAVCHNNTVTVYLEVTLVRIDDDVIVLIAAKHLSDHVAETFLQHAHQCSAVDVRSLFKFLEGLNHTWTYFFFFCCHSLLET